MAPFCGNFRDASMLLGYARVSTDDQDLALQRRALREAGCRRLYQPVDKIGRQGQHHKMLAHKALVSRIMLCRS